jgi:hypothetical protein
MAERSTAFFQRRIISSLTQSAEERYNDFLETYPSLVQQLPQYVIASYPGMTAIPSELCRIKIYDMDSKAKLQNKIALITGRSSGIGLGIATRFAAEKVYPTMRLMQPPRRR